MIDVVLAGVGMTRFTKQADLGHDGLVGRAVEQALHDAGLVSTQIEAAFVGSVAGGPALGQKSLKSFALDGAPVLNIENACASGSTAVHEAYAWVTAGIVECALAIGVEILSSAPRGPLQIPAGGWMFDAGLNLPAWYALRARQHMSDHGLTRQQLAAVAVKSRAVARHNPRAHFQTTTSIDEVLASPGVADPLTLFQCCPKTDGAAAVVVTTANYLARHSSGARPVRIRGAALGSGTAVFTDHRAESMASRVARQALSAAGVDPTDIDVAEVHDAFTIGEILYTEALGVCEPGQGGWLVERGDTYPGTSRLAVNTSGGLLSRGHPLGATGVAQLAEVAWQLRGECGARQQPSAHLGAVHTMGASDFELDGNICTVFVLEAVA